MELAGRASSWPGAKMTKKLGCIESHFTLRRLVMRAASVWSPIWKPSVSPIARFSRSAMPDSTEISAEGSLRSSGVPTGGAIPHRL